MSRSSHSEPFGNRRWSGVAGLVFDMGDVLFDATAWRRWLLEHLANFGLSAKYRSFFAVWDRDYLDDVHRGVRRYDEAFRSFLRASGLTEAQVEEVAAASTHRKRELEAEVRPFAGVGSTLRRLRNRGYDLAVLSDSESSGESIRCRLDVWCIGHLFTAVVSSSDLSLTKPARQTYLHVAERLRLQPAQIAFVGHDAEELQGARRAGMSTIAFNHESGVTADAYLSRFDELSEMPASSVGQSRSFRNAA